MRIVITGADGFIGRNLSVRLGEQGFTRARRTDQQNVRFRQFDVGTGAVAAVFETFIVVVNRHGEHAFGAFLTNHVIIQHMFDFGRVWDPFAGAYQLCLVFFTDDVHAQFNAFVTNEDVRSGNQFADLVLGLSAEATVQGIFGVGRGGCFAHVARPCLLLSYLYFKKRGASAQAPN